jgi:hypothetical protein
MSRHVAAVAVTSAKMNCKVTVIVATYLDTMENYAVAQIPWDTSSSKTEPLHTMQTQ